jgi:hypothetical protein
MEVDAAAAGAAAGSKEEGSPATPEAVGVTDEQVADHSRWVLPCLLYYCLVAF